jgi:hypothetical protein
MARSAWRLSATAKRAMRILRGGSPHPPRMDTVGVWRGGYEDPPRKGLGGRFFLRLCVAMAVGVATLAAAGLRAQERAVAAAEVEGAVLPGSDIVTTTHGDRLVGTVTTMDSGGTLRLTGPQYQKEVVLAAGVVASLKRTSSGGATGGDEVVLAGGDRVFGTVSAITADAVLVDSPAAGALKIPRGAVLAVNRAAPANVLVACNFDRGKLEPWSAGGDGSSWRLADGALVCTPNPNSVSQISTTIDIKEALAVEVHFVSAGAPLAATLVLMGEGADAGGGGLVVVRRGRGGGMGGGNLIQASIQSAPGSLSYNLYAGNRSMGKGVSVDEEKARSVLVRLSYDPATGEVRFGPDGQDPIVQTLAPKLETLKSVTLNLGSPVRVESIRVVRGVGAAAGAAGAGGAGAAVEFTNGDRVAVTQVTLVGEEAKITTAQGEVRCPAKTVARVAFGGAADAPKVPPEYAQVSGPFGRLAFLVQRLTADEVVGRSETLGEIKLRRSAVREIKFPAAALPPSPPAPVPAVPRIEGDDGHIDNY